MVSTGTLRHLRKTWSCIECCHGEAFRYRVIPRVLYGTHKSSSGQYTTHSKSCRGLILCVRVGPRRKMQELIAK